MARQQISGPLTERDLPELKRLRENIKVTSEYVAKCERCKLDVSQEKSACEDQLQVIGAILREFFPNNPL